MAVFLVSLISSHTKGNQNGSPSSFSLSLGFTSITQETWQGSPKILPLWTIYITLVSESKNFKSPNFLKSFASLMRSCFFQHLFSSLSSMADYCPEKARTLDTQCSRNIHRCGYCASHLDEHKQHVLHIWRSVMLDSSERSLGKVASVVQGVSLLPQTQAADL